MKVLVTGSAGFIGFHLVEKLLKAGNQVVGYDNINDYYDVNLKYDRLKETGILRASIIQNELVQSNKYPNYTFIKADLTDKPILEDVFKKEKFDIVINLAAQAGVRYSLTNPEAYLKSNIEGFLNLLEACRNNPVKHLVFASSSSVYGANTKLPYSEHDSVDRPISLYAASKKTNELMAYTYSHLFKIPATGLRFFTVYGPWGRPDMAMALFTSSILNNQDVNIFNNGNMFRDFTYIDDIVEGIIRVMNNIPVSSTKSLDANDNEAGSLASYKVYNIGNSTPVKLMDYIEAIEKTLQIPAKRNYLPMQPGDVFHTYADTSELQKDVGYKPVTKIQEGIDAYVRWFKEYYNFS